MILSELLVLLGYPSRWFVQCARAFAVEYINLMSPQ